jgi:hypothetical protein
VSSYVLKYLLARCEYVDAVEVWWEWLASSGINEDRMQGVTSSYRSVDDDVTFGYEHARHIATVGFTPLSQGFVA